MAHVITRACCNDASCVAVCPVNCIHPTPDEPAYVSAEMLYIDPDACIDCGACIDVCPVDAIVADYDLAESDSDFQHVNAAYYRTERSDQASSSPVAALDAVFAEDRVLRIAIVGSGPSACYAAEALITECGSAVEISMIEKLPTPFGLVRFGVAPDHLDTKAVGKIFQKTATRKNVDVFLNVEVGQDILHDELLAHHDAVIYAVGAPGDKRLDVPGEDLAGSHSATEFIAWYNGHPDHSHRQFDLTGERAVVIGNGNVALDLARILVADEKYLKRTDIAQHAMDQLIDSGIREVVVIGRRGITQAAYSYSEVSSLGSLAGIDVVVDESDASRDAVMRKRVGAELDALAELKDKRVRDFGFESASQRSIRLRYLLSPVQILGSDRVEGVRLAHNELDLSAEGRIDAVHTDVLEDLSCSLVLRSVGYRGVGVAGMPSSGRSSTMSNVDGRVVDPKTGSPVGGAYTVGWIKRGPSGVIGTNKTCAAETVTTLLKDLQSETTTATASRTEFREFVAARVPASFDFAGWKAIDTFERRLGKEAGRPRIKLVDRDALVQVAKGQN